MYDEAWRLLVMNTNKGGEIGCCEIKISNYFDNH